MRDDPFPVIAGIFAAFMVLASFIVGHVHGRDATEQKAIRAGVAYYTNDASGMAQFKWKECK